MNNTTDKSSPTVDKYEKKVAYADTIYKFMISFIDKYGVMTVDWLGYVFGLNKEDRPLSEQSGEEISQNLKGLSESLKDPEVRAALMVTLKESEPVLKEAALTFLNVGMSSVEYIIKDTIDIACHSDTIDPICGMFKVAEDTIQFGDDLVQSADGALQTVNDGVEAADHIKEELEHNAEKFNQAAEQVTKPMTDATQALNDTTKNATQAFNNASEQIVKPITDATQNATQALNDASDQIKKGGAKMLIKQKKTNKTIENRIHHSISEFLNLKKGKPKSKKRKTKKRNSKSNQKKRKTKSKSK